MAVLTLQSWRFSECLTAKLSNARACTLQAVRRYQDLILQDLATGRQVLDHEGLVPPCGETTQGVKVREPMTGD